MNVLYGFNRRGYLSTVGGIPLECVDDFVVRRLAEVGIIKADRAEEFMIFQANNFVRFLAHLG